MSAVIGISAIIVAILAVGFAFGWGIGLAYGRVTRGIGPRADITNALRKRRP